MSSYINTPTEISLANRINQIRESLLNLLWEQKKSTLDIKCGIKAMDVITKMPEYWYSAFDKQIHIADCVINVKKDFDLDPWDIVHEGKVIFR